MGTVCAAGHGFMQEIVHGIKIIRGQKRSIKGQLCFAGENYSTNDAGKLFGKVLLGIHLKNNINEVE